MKLLRMSSTAVLSLLLGIAVPAFAQEAEHQEQKPERPEEQVQKDRAQKDQAQKDEHGQKKEEQRVEQNRVAQEKGDKREGKPARIPEERFRASYGRQHVFHVNRVTVVEGTPRFVYGGYTFVLVEPWPAGWAYADDCYIDDVDGEYFLFDLLHPGVRIAITVVL